MQKVLGVGGIFFRAQDPAKLATWYDEHLGVPPVPTDYDSPAWEQEAGTCVFAPFPADTDYFGGPDRMFMLNFRVADLDAMVSQLGSQGVAVEVDPETYPNGRFATLEDPEGNRIQLWEPGG